MERIHTPLGLRRALGDRARDPRSHVRGYEFQLFAALFAEGVEELKDRAAVSAGRGLHQPAGVVIDHDGHPRRRSLS